MDRNLWVWRDELNEAISRYELLDRQTFFNTIEKSPLTTEQATAVVTMDNRVRVVAAAGSGKTSVMVARAAYAVDRGIVPPCRILLLAFNRDAAQELQQRIGERLTPLGIDASGIRASTFHSFGLAMIGEATGAKPRLAGWLDGGQDIGIISRIVDELRDSSARFRFQWDLFRLVFARAPQTPETGDAEWFDRTTKVAGFRTRQGETVRSEGERMIADWLFTNGVEYQYERPYTYPTATAQRSHYHPDFFYPSVNVWHEHWALDENGNPPASFEGYADGIAWKRATHRANKTALIETTWADVMAGSGLERLGAELERRGVALDWNPDRPSAVPAMKHEDLARLIRQFMVHVKSNALSREDLARRVVGLPPVQRYRAQLFTEIFWPVHEAWQRRLANEGLVDFEDMLLLAAEVLENGKVKAPYDMVLVDEFQDSSIARARLVRALLKDAGKYLLAVGDDWQSINRFAGADLSIMTDFESWFGAGPTLRLETTFRCPQPIADVASTFVSKNPRQISKTVKSAVGNTGAGVRCYRAPSADAIPATVARILDQLASIAQDEGRDGRSGDKLTVDVLGRYRFDRDLVPESLPRELNVTFRTAHGSKGLEADYIIIPRMVAGRMGFPSGIEDDPLLNLVMADPDGFDHAEERRLFYVALTRAKRSTILVTAEGVESPFVRELLKDGVIHFEGAAGQHHVDFCPECGKGTLVVRNGKFGAFHACTRFPACRFTRSM